MELFELLEALVASVAPVFDALYEYLVSIYGARSTIASTLILYFIGPSPTSSFNSTGIEPNEVVFNATLLEDADLDHFMEDSIHPLLNLALDVWDSRPAFLRVEFHHTPPVSSAGSLHDGASGHLAERACLFLMYAMPAITAMWLCAKFAPRPWDAVDLALIQPIESTASSLQDIQRALDEVQPSSVTTLQSLGSADLHEPEPSFPEKTMPAPLFSMSNIHESLDCIPVASRPASPSFSPSNAASSEDGASPGDVDEPELPPMVFADPETLTPDVSIVSLDQRLSMSPTPSELSQDDSVIGLMHTPAQSVEELASTTEAPDDEIFLFPSVGDLQEDVDEDVNLCQEVEIVVPDSNDCDDLESLASEVIVSENILRSSRSSVSASTVDLGDVNDAEDPEQPVLMEIRETDVPGIIGLDIRYGSQHYVVGYAPGEPKKNIPALVRYQLDHVLRNPKSRNADTLRLDLNNIFWTGGNSLDSSVSSRSTQSEQSSDGLSVDKLCLVENDEDEEGEHRRAQSEPLFPSVPSVRREDSDVHPLPTFSSLEMMTRYLKDALNFDAKVDHALWKYKLATERSGRGNTLALVSRAELRKAKSTSDMRGTRFGRRAFLALLRRVPIAPVISYADAVRVGGGVKWAASDAVRPKQPLEISYHSKYTTGCVHPSVNPIGRAEVVSTRRSSTSGAVPSPRRPIIIQNLRATPQSDRTQPPRAMRPRTRSSCLQSNAARHDAPRRRVHSASLGLANSPRARAGPGSASASAAAPGVPLRAGTAGTSALAGTSANTTSTNMKTGMNSNARTTTPLARTPSHTHLRHFRSHPIFASSTPPSTLPRRASSRFRPPLLEAVGASPTPSLPAVSVPVATPGEEYSRRRRSVGSLGSRNGRPPVLISPSSRFGGSEALRRTPSRDEFVSPRGA